jgi:hypothetical protein
MAEPAEKLEEEQEDTMLEEEAKAALLSKVESLRQKAQRLLLLANPLRNECTETAELARKCEEAVGEI